MANNIIPAQAPYPKAILGYDGTDFYVVKVDGSGRLEVRGVTGAPTDVKYLVAEEDPSLSAEIVITTLAQLNALITDATLDDSADPRDPNPHAPSHKYGGSDELDASELSGELGTAGQVLKTDGTVTSWASGLGGFYDAYVCVRDVKPPGTHSGTFTSGGWRTRDINDEHADTADLCSIADNQITLAAGTYHCYISAPCYNVDSNQARLYNITDTVEILPGTGGRAHVSYGGWFRSIIAGRFTLAAQKILEVQHQCNTTREDIGFGYPGSFTSEVYTIAEFWREA